MPKTRNIIIFAAIAIILVLIYWFFLRPAPETATLISTSSGPGVPVTAENNPSVPDDFLALLLSVKNIKLNDAIFSDNAFMSLRDNPVILILDGTEGRPNPFAPIGTDIIAQTITTPSAPTPPVITPPVITPPATTPKTVPPKTTAPSITIP